MNPLQVSPGNLSTSFPLVPAPAAFRPAGLVLAADFSDSPMLRKRRYTGRRLEGVRYEKKVQAYLQEFHGNHYIPSPWLRFFTGGAWRWCQPDGILLDPARGRLTIVEVKYQHTSDAWWQVRQLYEPVLRVMFPESLWAYSACEVVKWYDPAVLFPEKTVLAQDVGMTHPAFKIHIWRP